MTYDLWTRRMFVWGVVVLMVLLVTGCGHRASHGIQKHGKRTGKATVVASQGDRSPVVPEEGLNGITSGGEGYFPEGTGTFSDLLQEDPIWEGNQLGTDSLGTDLQAHGFPHEYWVNRTRAEQLTAESGLQDVHFDFDSFQLNEQAKVTLRANAEWLKAHPHAEITIEGHCDDRGTASYNQVLGEKRAIRTKNYLAGLGVSVERLHIMSFGKDNPACWDSTELCYRKNRRAHLVLDISVASTAMPFSVHRME
jgi:peptidoglycan-associated lipoprotein